MSEPYIYDVSQNLEDSHQTSPGWMLTFVRWINRDPLNFKGNSKTVSEPLVVTNDCISVTINSSKNSHTPSVSAILKSGDINYLTAVAPGDFLFVNILNWGSNITKKSQQKQNDSPLYARAKGFQAINKLEDGFKGFFKVQSVRRVVSVDPNTGKKEVVFYIDGYGFTEFNNVIYFNQHLIPPGSTDNPVLFTTNLSKFWHTLFTSSNGLPDVQDIVRFFIKAFIGEGEPPKLNETVKNAKTNSDVAVKFGYNTKFYVPQGVGSLLGQSSAKAAKDLYVYSMGIQSYTNSGNLQSVFNFVPNSSLKESRFYYTTKGPCQGRAFVKPDYWNQATLWSILQEYLNSPINEMYVAYRPAKNGYVMPVLVMRQIPFSSDKYSGTSTKFLSMPRWRVSSKMIFEANIGRDEAARLNFVQVFGKMAGYANPSLSITQQMAEGNYKEDGEDIQRSGLRPYVITSNFDQPSTEKDATATFSMAMKWKDLLADALIGGHLKLNGTITCVGIEEPIAPGDNLELGDTVYHIESVIHKAAVDANGRKMFRTTLELSHGVSKHGSREKKVYSQMVNSKMDLEEKYDHHHEGMLPGAVSEEVGYKDPYFDTDPEKSNTSFDLPPKGFNPPQKKNNQKNKKRSK